MTIIIWLRQAGYTIRNSTLCACAIQADEPFERWRLRRDYCAAMTLCPLETLI